MKSRFLGLGLLLAASIAACTASNDDTSTSDPAKADELNESKALGMTDVTILYPTPEKWEFVDDMLGPTSEDARGELLPASLFAQIADLPAPKMIAPNGTEVDPPQPKLFARWADNFAYLRVVGIRLDPCFGETQNLGANDCLSTIRLVAQFLFKPNQQSSGAPLFDSSASVHLFYKVSQADFTALAKEMLALRLSTGMPLQKGLVSPQQSGVHPMLQQQGLRGDYATRLKAIILKYAGAQTLARIAFAVQDRQGSAGGYYNNQGNPDTRWVFGGFEHRGGSLAPLNIASLGDYTGLQTMDSFPSQRGDKPPVVVTPAISIPDNILGAFNPSSDASGIAKARDSARKLQNPNDYTTKSTDCVSCHMSKEALFTIGQQPSDLDFKSYTFRLDHTLEQLGPFRMFGWDQGRPVISARVVNETANVLEFLNKNVLR